MKFLAIQFASVFSLSSVFGAALMTRDDPQQNQTVSQYPNSTDIGSLNGTWYLTGLTSNVWDVYKAASQTMHINAECFQVSISSTSNSTLDLMSSAFLNKTTANKGVNVTAAGALLLQPPSNDLNVSAHDLSWSAYLSQAFANKAQWDNLTSECNENSTESTAIPGSEPMQANINTRLFDSNAQVGSNDSTSFDTLFVWCSHTQSLGKRDGDIIGLIFSTNPSVSEDTFNKTLTMLPTAVDNATIVLLADSCNTQQ